MIKWDGDSLWGALLPQYCINYIDAVLYYCVTVSIYFNTVSNVSMLYCNPVSTVSMLYCHIMSTVLMLCIEKYFDSAVGKSFDSTYKL